MSEFDLTLIRKKLAKDLGTSAGANAKPVKGPYDVRLGHPSRDRYIKLAAVGFGVVFMVGLVAFLLEPREPAPVSTSSTASVEPDRSPKVSALEKLTSLPATPAVSAPLKPEPVAPRPPIEVKAVEVPGFYVQVAAYRGLRFLNSAQERVAHLGFDKNMVVKETFWTPQYFIVDAADEADPVARASNALGSLRSSLLVERSPEQGVRVGPIYYSGLIDSVRSKLSGAGIIVKRTVVAEPELIYLLLLGPYQSEGAAGEAKSRLKSFAPDAMVQYEKGSHKS